MIILGIDPGTATTGCGIIEFRHGELKLAGYSCVKTSAGKPLPERLKLIHAGLTALIERYRPEIIVIEQLFFNTNTKTALAVGQARGVAILAAVNSGAEVVEYTPLQVKQALVGYGRADKKQVQYMVKTVLKLKEPPKPDDAADALALAICHAHSLKFKTEVKKADS